MRFCSEISWWSASLASSFFGSAADCLHLVREIRREVRISFTWSTSVADHRCVPMMIDGVGLMISFGLPDWPAKLNGTDLLTRFDSAFVLFGTWLRLSAISRRRFWMV